MQKIYSFFQRKLLQPFIDLLIQGITPEKLALSVVFGVVLGIIPILGATTILCAVVAVRLKLNMPAIQTINWFIYPLQLILFIPFLKAGSFFLPGVDVVFTIEQVFQLMKTDFWLAAKQLWLANLVGLIIWAILSVPVGIGLYFIFKKLFYFVLNNKVLQLKYTDR